MFNVAEEGQQNMCNTRRYQFVMQSEDASLKKFEFPDKKVVKNLFGKIFKLGDFFHLSQFSSLNLCCKMELVI